MSVTHTVTRIYKDQSANSITDARNVTGNAELNIDDSVAIAANHQIHWSCTRANLQSLCFWADGPVTVYTNNPSGSSPQDTIPLVANQARDWVLASDLIALCPVSNDVTTVYVTNAGSGAVAFRIRAVLNQ